LTEGYFGSDLTKVCVTAAYEPIWELLDKEKKGQEIAELQGLPPAQIVGLDGVPVSIRALSSMDDLHKACHQDWCLRL
jgi:SpoVK/Ycf46/Vps4 family AAA+-type ATPase